MVSVEYANAYSEVLGILKCVSKEEYEMIPENKIKLFEANSNKEYEFIYNPEKSLNEQNVSKRAKAIIGLLFRDYWATKGQKEKIIEKQIYNRKKIEEIKREKYNPDNLFKNKAKKINVENMELTEYKEQKWYQKIFERLLNIFRKR